MRQEPSGNLLLGRYQLVQTVLANFQESYQFWLEVAEQVASAYNSQGVQKAKGRNSGFVSKA